MPRKRDAPAPRIHTGLRLDPSILERLNAPGRAVSDQIRERLLRTFAEDDLDAATREFRDFLVRIAASVRADFGCEWHDKPRAHEAFAAAVAHRLAAYKPAYSGGASDLLHHGPDDPPDTIGRLREHDDRRAHEYPRLKAALERTRRDRFTALNVRKSDKGERQ